MTPAGRRRLVFIVLALLITGLSVGAALFLRGRHGNDSYHCPMHPTMVSDRPGDCPICGMRKSPVEVETAASSPAGTSGSMRLRVEGYAPVTIPSRKQQLIGVRTTAVGRAPFIRTIRAVGRVAADETRLRHVHTKIDGWVERLYVNAAGEKVRAGQPLLDIYSPELLATQEEFLLALRMRPGVGDTVLPEVAQSADELVTSARRRLLLFDLTPQQIDALETRGTPTRTVTLHAPISGYVLQRNVTQGERIGPDASLLDIADLSRVWVLASVYEYELPFVRVGQPATTTLSYVPGTSYEGRVTLIYPTLEEGTRTVQVRLEIANPRLDLRPGMYAEVGIQSDLGGRLSVPESAVISTGARDIVFVAEGEGYFSPREVRVGLRLPDAVEILEGLAEGEMVVVSAAFFVDSESKLKSALEAAAGSRSTPEHGH